MFNVSCTDCGTPVQSLGITLKGYTNAPLDESIDSFRAATLPLFKACGISATVSTRQRAVPPEGRAAVHVTVEALRTIEHPIRLTEEGLVRRVRGVAWTVNMGPQNAKAAFSSAKGVLLKLLADVQIFTDVVSIRPKLVRSAARMRVPAAPLCSSPRTSRVMRLKLSGKLVHIEPACTSAGCRCCSCMLRSLNRSRSRERLRVLQGQTRAAPGYGILLVAETTAGRYLTAERCISGAELLQCKEQEITASDVGQQAACMLLDEIQRCAPCRHLGTLPDRPCRHRVVPLVRCAAGKQWLPGALPTLTRHVDAGGEWLMGAISRWRCCWLRWGRER